MAFSEYINFTLPASHCFAIRSSICQSRGWKVSFKNRRFYITRSIWLEGTIKKPLSYFLSSWNLGNSRTGGGVGGQDIYFDDASWITLCYLVNNDTYCTTFLIEMTADVFVCLVLKTFLCIIFLVQMCLEWAVGRNKFGILCVHYSTTLLYREDRQFSMAELLLF